MSHYARLRLAARFACIRAAAGLAALLAPAVASAQEDAEELQYRRFQLGDGREFVAIILATEAAGFKVRVPQGEMQVSFAQLYDMVPVTRAEYESQQPWTVYLQAPAEREKGLIAAFEAIPHVQVHGSPNAKDSPLSGAQYGAAAGCGGDIVCVQDALTDAPWVWIVVARQEGADIVMEAKTNKGGPAKNPQRGSILDPNGVSGSAWKILEVTPSQVADTVADGGGDGTTGDGTPGDGVADGNGGDGNDGGDRVGGDPDRARLRKLAYVPIPGMPSLASGDMGGFGLSMATALPASALWFGAVGKASQSAPQHLMLGVGGFYAITVAVNHAVGVGRGTDGGGGLGMSLEPTDHGGAAVRLTVID